MKSLLLLLRRQTALLLFFILNFALINDLHAQVCTGDITLSSQAEVDAFNCTEVTGSLTISGSDITNLDALSGLTKVGDWDGGDITISDNDILTSINGLTGLTGYINQLNINRNPALTNIDGLSGVQSIGEIYISYNDVLSNIDGLSGVMDSEGRTRAISIVGNNALNNVDGLSYLIELRGSLWIKGNGALINIDGLARLIIVDGDLRIRDNSALTRCCILYPLLKSGRVAGTIDISGNGAGCTETDIIANAQCFNCKSDIYLSSQAEVDAFNCTEVTGHLSISGSDITNLDALSGLTKVGSYLAIRSNPVLNNLDGLSGLTNIGGDLIITRNDVLTNIDGLSGLMEVDKDVEIGYNKVLISIDGLYSLTKVGRYIAIYINDALTNIDGLSGMKEVSVVGISGNIALTNVDGLLGLTEIDRMFIRHNNALTNVDGLSGLTKAGNIEIIDNANLNECCGLYPLLSNGGVAGTINISGNGAGCTETDIIANGPCDVICEGDITLSSQAEVDAFNCTEVSGNLTISGSDITNLDALSGLTKVSGYIMITENHALANLDGLSGWTEVGSGGMYIISNNALTNINGLSGLMKAGGINLWSNKALSNVDGLSGLTKVDGISFESNDALTNIDGLSGLTEVGDISFLGNGALTNIDGLSGLTKVERIYIEHTALTNIDGLSGLTKAGSIRMRYNSALTNINGLSGLTEVVGDLSIEDNYSLNLCCGLYPLLSSGTVGGNISINSNGNGFWCTESDIIANGPCTGEGTLIVNAKGSAAGGVYAHFKVMVDGQEIGDAYTTSNFEAYAFTFTWTLPNDPEKLQEVDIVFDNDAVIDGSDRNLYVQSIELNGELIPAKGNNVTYDAGTYNGVMPINGILYFRINIPGQKIIVNAKGSEAGGVYTHFRVLVDGVEIGDAYTSSNYEAYAFTLPNDLGMIQEVGIVFDNDAVINGNDRNLYVQSIDLNGEVIPAPGDYVTYDAGTYNGVMPINGILYFGIYDLYAPLCNGDITLSSQEEVNAFNCEVVNGSLTIGGGWYLHPSDITNLDGLSELKSVGGLSINYNPLLSDLEELSGLSGNIGDISIWDNDMLENLDELKGITSVDSRLEIAYCDALENLDGLSQITSVGGYLYVGENSNLNRCCGLYPLLSGGGVAGTIGFYYNGAGCTESDIIANGPCDREGTLIVNAKGSEAGGVYTHFRVLIDGVEIGDTYTTSSYEAYAFALPKDPGMIQEVGIVFDNDAVIDGSDRNLYVQSIELNGEVIPAPGENVTYDAGTYKGVMPINGILYFRINIPEATLIVNAKGSEAGGVYSHFRVLIDGVEIGDAYTTYKYKGYAFTLPKDPGMIQEVGIVFDNDAVIDGSDRNLCVQSIELNGEVIHAPGENVTYVTGDLTRDYQGVMPWSGVLYFRINIPEGTLIVNAKGSEAGDVYSHFRVLVDGVGIGDAYTTSKYEAYAFTLPNDPGMIQEVGIVFDNDAVIDGSDRNLCVQSIELNGEVIHAPGDNVTYVTGDRTRDYQGVMPWSGILYFDINGDEAKTSTSTKVTSNTENQSDKEKQIDLAIYPNPFEQGINIEFNVLANSEVTLSINDQQGRILNVIQKDNLEIGRNLIQLSRDEILGRNASSGLYLLRLDLADINIHKRILLR